MGTKALARNALAGIFGGRTATFYRLDPTGRVPVATIGEVYGRFNGNKITIDMISSESGETRTDVSEYPIEDYEDAITGVSHKPERRTIAGILTSAIQVPLLGGVGAGGILAAVSTIFAVPGAQPQLIQIANLRAMQKRGEPVYVLTPRWSGRMMLESVSDSWAPGQGESLRISVGMREARILDGVSLADEGPDLLSLPNYNQNSAGPQGSGASTATATGGGTLAAPTIG